MVLFSQVTDANIYTANNAKKTLGAPNNNCFCLKVKLVKTRTILMMVNGHCPVADPGFPRGGGTNPSGEEATYDFANFSQKLQEIERIVDPGKGGARP